jgi:ring-1,2-phenylacetyl-CoA epoxidase subunit PaaC
VSESDASDASDGGETDDAGTDDDGDDGDDGEEGWPEEAIELVQAIADTKFVLSQRYAEWMLAGPSLEDDIGGASAAQDEAGHVRQLFRLLAGEGREQGWLEGNREPAEFANAAPLDAASGSWTDHLVSVAVSDRAAWYLLDSIVHEDFSGLGEKIGEDEFFHLEYHDARLETLAADEPRALQSALGRTLPGALAFIGPADYDDGADPLVDTGFTDRSVTAIREGFLAYFDDCFAGTDVSLDAIDRHAPEIDEWNGTRRRIGEGEIEASTLDQLTGRKNELYRIQ